MGTDMALISSLAMYNIIALYGSAGHQINMALVELWLLDTNMTTSCGTDTRHSWGF